MQLRPRAPNFVTPSPPLPAVAFPRTAIWVLPVLLIILIGAQLGWNTWRGYQDTLAREYQLLEAQAHTADAQITGALRSIDLLLRRLAEERSRMPPPQTDALEAFQQERMKSFPEVRFLLTTNREGRVTSASSSIDSAIADKIRGIDVAQREYFSTHRDAHVQAHDDYFVSRPIITATSGITTIVVSRAIRAADGRFAGVAVATLAPKYFLDVLNPILPHDAGQAVLVNTAGDILSALPDPSLVGKSIARGQAFTEHLKAAKRITRHMNPSAVTGIERVSVLRRLDYPELLVIVARDADAVLSAWHQDALRQTLLFLVVTGVTLFLTRLAYRRQKEAFAAQGFSQRLIETANVMVVGFDMRGTVTIFNEAAETISGYRRDEVLDRNWFELVVPQLRYPQVWATYAPLAAGGNLPRTFESPMLAKDGQERIIAWQNNRATDPSTASATVSFGIDITERKRSEEVLKRSESALHRAQSVAQVGSWHLDNKARTLEWSEETYRIFGVAPDQPMTLKSFIATVHPEDQAYVLEQWNQALAGKPYDIEHRILVNGELRWINEKADLVFDAAGVLVSGIGTAQDITKRRAAEDKIRQGEKHLRQLMDESPLPMLMLLGDTEQVEFVNRRFAQTLGYTLQDIPDLEHWWPKAYPDPSYRRQVKANWASRVAEARQSGSAITPAEVSIVCRNGELRIFDIRLTSIDQRSLVVFIDLTEHRRIEQELRETTDIAESANRAKGEFLANMSHEIRTPMNAIIGLSQLAQDEPLTPTLRDYLGKIHGSARALLGILNDILDYSKIEAGRLQVEAIEFSLEQVLDNLATLFSLSAEQKGLKLALTLAPDVPQRLTGDPLRLTQVLSNLISNAVKFTEAGEVAIEVGCTGQAENIARLRFTVRDSGVGINPATLAQLFQPFVQGDSSITRRYGGTGLGLIITRRLVDLMRGELRVKSEEGRGSTFTVEIAFGLHEAATPQPLAALTAPMRSFAGARVLAVEDNAINRQVITELLRRKGVRISSAENGAAALALLDTEQFDAVLMDAHMPIMDGLEATRRLRRDPRHARLPIIALSAAAMIEERAACIEAGMDDFIAKPIDDEQLMATLQRWLPDAAHIDDQSAASAATRPPDALSLPPLAGFDMERLEDIVAGDLKLLRTLLQTFHDQHGDDVDAIEAQLAALRDKKALQLAHGLRGSAANLGATAVAQSAQALEALLQNATTTTALRQAALLDLRNTLTRAQQATATFLAQTKPTAMESSPVSFDSQTAHALLEKLSSAVKAHELIAPALLSALESALNGRAATETRKLSVSLARYDFNTAQEALTAIEKEIR